MGEDATLYIEPQPGRQTQFLSSPADIVFYGGAAGGGKTYGLLLEPLHYITRVEGFGAVFFRRTMPQITGEGGVWDESVKLYTQMGATTKRHDWHFPPYDNRIQFTHMALEKNVYDWKSAQIALILYDQGEDFTRHQFFYMLSRNRSRCRVKPYIRLAYNPVPADDPTGGWIHEFVGWYLDDNGEYPDESKAGIIRWFVNYNNELHWFATEAEATEAFPSIMPKSFTYIPADVYDNPALLESNPEYLANLYALDPIDQERLLRANHKIRPSAGNVFNRAWFEIIDALPSHAERPVRFWDLAATERDVREGAATAGVKMTRWREGVDGEGKPLYTYCFLDCIEEHFDPSGTDRLLKNTASQDGRRTAQRWEEEGGSGGKRDSRYIARMLTGYDAKGVRPTGDKLVRSRALSAQAKAGNVKLLRGPWNDLLLNRLHDIPDGDLWDVHDAAAGSFNELATRPTVRRKPPSSKTIVTM